MRLTVATFIAALTLLPSVRAAPPPGVENHDPAERDWVKHWHNQEGMWCCDIDSDCRPTDVRADPGAGSGYDAWIDKATYGPTAPDAWVPAKALSMGRPHAESPTSWTFSEDNPTPRAWACWYAYEVRCLSVPAGR